MTTITRPVRQSSITPTRRATISTAAAAFAERFRQRAEIRHGRTTSGVLVYSRAAGFGSASTYHGLGGVVMNRAATMDGAVRGYENLYVVDCSFVPGAVGLVNPALTITALAERTMERFLARR